MGTTEADDIMAGFPPPPHLRPGPTNWDLAPFNRWSFCNMRQLMPTIDVRRGDHVSRLPEAPVDLDGLGVAPGRTLIDLLGDTQTDGFLVWWKGAVRYRRFFGHMHAASQHLSQSVAKSVVGTLALLLIDDGVIDRNALVETIIPELAATGYRGARLQDCLDMRSGAAFVEDYDHPLSDMTRVDRATFWRPTPAGAPEETIADVILSLRQERPHGGPFKYRSIETDVIAWVIERVTGRRLAELISERIWQPMGAERDAFFTVDRAGTALADGGFNATLDDYARFGLLWLEAGHDTGRSMLPLSILRDTQAGDPSAFDPAYHRVTPNGAYRNQWWIRDHRRGDIAARGIFGQMIYCDPAGDFLAVKLSSWPEHLNPDKTLATYRALDAIRQHLEERLG